MNDLNFEQSILELNDIIKKLQDPNISIDESVSLYSKGIDISKNCREKLDVCEKFIIEKMTKDGVMPLEG